MWTLPTLTRKLSFLGMAALVYCLTMQGSAWAQAAHKPRPQENCFGSSSNVDVDSDSYRQCRARNFQNGARDALDAGNFRAWEFLQVSAANGGDTNAAKRLCQAWRNGEIVYPERTQTVQEVVKPTAQAESLCAKVTAAANVKPLPTEDSPVAQSDTQSPTARAAEAAALYERAHAVMTNKGFLDARPMLEQALAMGDQRAASDLCLTYVRGGAYPSMDECLDALLTGGQKKAARLKQQEEERQAAQKLADDQEKAKRDQLAHQQAQREAWAHDAKLTTLLGVTVGEPLLYEHCLLKDSAPPPPTEVCWLTAAEYMNFKASVGAKAGMGAVLGMLTGNVKQGYDQYMSTFMSASSNDQLPPLLYASLANARSMNDMMAGISSNDKKLLRLTPQQRENFPWLVAGIAIVEQHDKVVAMQVTTDGPEQQKVILDALKEKFGSPTVQRMKTYQNNYFTHWQLPEFVWTRPTTEVVFGYTSEDPKNADGVLTVTSRGYVDEVKVEKKSKAKL
jgi:hypothetical protein